jgi:hypothetical protein
VTSKMSDIHFCNIWHPFLKNDIHFCNSWHPLSKCDIQNVWHPFLKWLELDIQFHLSECGHPIPKFIVDVWHPLFWNWMSAGAIWMSHSTQNGFGCLTSKFGPNWMLGSSTFLWCYVCAKNSDYGEQQLWLICALIYQVVRRAWQPGDPPQQTTPLQDYITFNYINPMLHYNTDYNTITTL